RVAYTHQIQELRDAVVSLASMVDKAIARSVDALKLQDVQLAWDVIRSDAAINRQRWQTEERALLIIATQAPMAGDLRTIAAVIHIVTDLERMADHAAGNARIVVQTAEEPLLKPLVDIPRMSELARAMLADSITAFIQEDADAARAIVERDDEVDELYDQVYRELLTYMMADPSTINRATHLLWAAHNVERIGDRVTNICERVVFAATGTLEEMAVSTY
ncbi:MAG TPA: phosphate signaling complex protein PhoU, partial [Thermomicrobiales bacterium]|nr:phosphate signaling complex protein PhoU [Thermomicrobiales bacterium]